VQDNKSDTLFIENAQEKDKMKDGELTQLRAVRGLCAKYRPLKYATLQRIVIRSKAIVSYGTGIRG
jgi:hypothetical protein